MCIVQNGPIKARFMLDRKTVYIGGASSSFELLASADAVKNLTADGRIGLYMHANGMDMLSQASRTQLWSNWGVSNDDTRNYQTIGEVGGFESISSSYLTIMGGIYPKNVNMNILTNSGDGTGLYVADNKDKNPGTSYSGFTTTYDLMKMMTAIDAARSSGADTVAIFVTPNGGGEDLDDPFSTSPYWANVRTAALYGGGIALDVPPSYWLARGEKYQSLVKQMLSWATDVGIRSSLTVSPHALKLDQYGNSGGRGYDPDFLDNTKKFFASLDVNSHPSEWIVESYSVDGTENAVTAEDTAGTLAEVALWLSQNASPKIIFSDDFDKSFSGTWIGNQPGTNLEVYTNGNVLGWTKSVGEGDVNAVDRGNANYAIMLFDNNIIYKDLGVVANVDGAKYRVSFTGSEATSTNADQVTRTGDYVEFRINDDLGTIASYKFSPSVLTTAFVPASFTYTGRGTGRVYLLIMDGGQYNGRYGAAIDDIEVTGDFLPIKETSTIGSGTTTQALDQSQLVATISSALDSSSVRNENDASTPVTTSNPIGSNVTVDGSETSPSDKTLTAFDADQTISVTAKPDPLFDVVYYVSKYHEMLTDGVDPYQDFLTDGSKQGRNPSTLFDTSYYLSHNPDVAVAEANPLSHFETIGWREGRDPSAAFDVRDYLAANPDVKAAKLNPLLHYVNSGKSEGRSAFAVSVIKKNPLLDVSYYYQVNPDVRIAGIDANAHYAEYGSTEGRSANALFDKSYYLTENPDVRAAGFDPLQHFAAYGSSQGFQPSLLFDDAKYLEAYSDVAAAGVNPLAHYVQSGQFENRQIFLTGGTRPVDSLVDTTFYDRQLGATLIPSGVAGAQQAAWSYDTIGWQAGLSPNSLFDTEYYLSHNPDVAAAHINPLTHYESNGWKEGRDASAQFSSDKYLSAYVDVKSANIDPLWHYINYGLGEGRTAFIS